MGITQISDQAYLAASERFMRGASVLEMLQAAAPYLHCQSCEGEGACSSARVADEVRREPPTEQ